MQLIMQGVTLRLVGEANHAAGVIRLVTQNLANLETVQPEMSNSYGRKNLLI